MMNRTAPPDTPPLRALAAISAIALGFGIAATSFPAPASAPGSIGGLLHRAQSQAESHHFNELLKAVESEKPASPKAHVISR